MTVIRRGLLALLALVAAGCMVGPEYEKPSVPRTPAYKEGGGWKVGQPADQLPRGAWWRLFGDPELRRAGRARGRGQPGPQARGGALPGGAGRDRFQSGCPLPTISSGVGASSIRESNDRPFFPPGATGSSGDFLASLDMSYEIDLWGRIRRSVAAARQEAQASAADAETVKLSLQGAVAVAYFELRSADAQQWLLDLTLKAYAASLELTTSRFAEGIAPQSDVALAQTQLDTTRAQATDIGVQRAQLERAIATLVGTPPAAFDLPPQRDALRPPRIPVGLPSELLERRPDIAAAERRVAEANEQIGIARAAYYPTVVLNASVGFESASPASWFSWPSLLWAVGLSMTQTLFDGGRRAAVSEGARAAYDATVANYRQTTLTAFQQVEDNLAALRILAQEADEQRRAVASSRQSLQLSTQRYEGGADSYLTAQTIALSNERVEVDIRRRRMDASVLLIKALGGGWQTADLPSP